METVTEIVDHVYSTWKVGRIASWRSVSIQMCEYIAKGGKGVHLEIGVMHGATLAMAALIKKHINQGGIAIGLDPLDGYYPPSALHDDFVRTRGGGIITTRKEKLSNTDISLAVVKENLEQYDIEGYYHIIKEFSYPWPAELRKMEFSTVYIDGDHYRLGPLADWISVHSRVAPGGYVLFDDVNNCPDVADVVKIANRTPGWEHVTLLQAHCNVLRKK